MFRKSLCFYTIHIQQTSFGFFPQITNISSINEISIVVCTIIHFWMIATFIPVLVDIVITARAATVLHTPSIIFVFKIRFRFVFAHTAPLFSDFEIGYFPTGFVPIHKFRFVHGNFMCPNASRNFNVDQSLDAFADQ